MGFWNKKSEPTKSEHINWELLHTEEELSTLVKKSMDKPQIIFKHSTTCSISSMAKRRLERQWNIDEARADIHYLDLLSYRNISNKIAADLGVTHQSPQIIIVKNGQAIFNTSHNDIGVDVIEENL
jgi:bacillithiol system protein YtxJ